MENQNEFSEQPLEDFFNFKAEPKEPRRMSKEDFVKQTKLLLDKLHKSYFGAWANRSLEINEYPNGSICDKCKGCGEFIDKDETKECFRDDEQGQCFHRYCDYELVGIELGERIDDILGLLNVDEVVN
jgi:hypothetical protein